MKRPGDDPIIPVIMFGMLFLIIIMLSGCVIYEPYPVQPVAIEPVRPSQPDSDDIWSTYEGSVAGCALTMAFLSGVADQRGEFTASHDLMELAEWFGDQVSLEELERVGAIMDPKLKNPADPAELIKVMGRIGSLCIQEYVSD